jgi:hypothetical protein
MMASSRSAGAVYHLGDRAAARHFAHVLAEKADGDTAIDQDLATIRLLLPGDHAEQRGFAGAVGADQADLLALLQRGRGLDEDQARAVLLTDVVQANHGSSAAIAGCLYTIARHRDGSGQIIARPASGHPRGRRLHFFSVR